MPRVCLIAPEDLVKLDAIKNEPRSKELYDAIQPRDDKKAHGRQRKDEDGDRQDGYLNAWVRHVGDRFNTVCKKPSDPWVKAHQHIPETEKQGAWNIVSTREPCCWSSC